MGIAQKLEKEMSVSSFEELAELVQPFRKNGEWIFRGMRESTHVLLPKIGRSGARRGVGSPTELPYDRNAEMTMIRHFMRSAGPYVKHVPTSMLEWLALAQHHGMFTRLLDWTESLFVAAYFAVEDARYTDSPPIIYCVKNVPVAPSGLHDEIDKLEDVMLYYPPHISPRIPAQGSVFTVHKNPDQQFLPDELVKITIDKSPLTIKLNLHACGIHKASLFPGIDGLAEYQSWLYKWGEHMRYE